MAREDFAFGRLPAGPAVAGLPGPARAAALRYRPPARARAATFLVAAVDGELVGRSSIRHELNDFLRREGGHIGYGVLAEHRRRGRATEMLRQSVISVAGGRRRRVLVTCDHDNVGSATVIERCGGVLHSVIDCEDGIPQAPLLDRLTPPDPPPSRVVRG